MDRGLAAMAGQSKEAFDQFQKRLDYLRSGDSEPVEQRVASDAEVDAFLRSLQR